MELTYHWMAALVTIAGVIGSIVIGRWLLFRIPAIATVREADKAANKTKWRDSGHKYHTFVLIVIGMEDLKERIPRANEDTVEIPSDNHAMEGIEAPADELLDGHWGERLATALAHGDLSLPLLTFAHH